MRADGPSDPSETETHPGPAKEGIVLDAEGHTIYEPEATASGPNDPFGFGAGRAGAQVRVFRGGWGLAIVLGIAIPLLFFAGVVILGVLAAILLVSWILRAIFTGPSRR